MTSDGGVLDFEAALASGAGGGGGRGAAEVGEVWGCWRRGGGCWRRRWWRTGISRRLTGRRGMGLRCGRRMSTGRSCGWWGRCGRARGGRGRRLERGEAVEIMTGAPLPEGADAVVMVEHVVGGGGMGAGRWRGGALAAGENVVPRGAEARRGEVVLPGGTPMGAAEIALAAACGAAEVPVFARPRVAIVATGDELVELEEMPEAWQIRNSNSYALAALVEAAGGEAVRLAIARDTREDAAGADCGGGGGAICWCCRVGFRWASMTWWRRCWRSWGRSFSLPG